MSEWVDFRRVKEQVRLIDVIHHYGVSLQAIGPGCLRGRCPLPTHSSKDSALSFSINTARNVWTCHSQSCVGMRGGAIGGNVLDSSPRWRDARSDPQPCGSNNGLG
jgi:hypothetical protein